MSAILETIIGVFIVGLIIITVLQVQSNFSIQNIINTQSLSTQITAYTLNRQLCEDIKSIGYNLVDYSNSIISADSVSITFETDLNNDSIEDTVQIFTRPLAADSTSNPYDFEIIRDINGTQYDYNVVGLTDFHFTYYDINGSETSVPNQIRSVSFQFEIMGTEPMATGQDSSRVNYSIATGEERIFIKNLFNW